MSFTPSHIIRNRIRRKQGLYFRSLLVTGLFFGSLLAYAAVTFTVQYGTGEYGAGGYGGAVVVPVLSMPADDSTSPTAAATEVVTDEVGGTLYTVVTESATSPSAAQIIAGDDHTDADAAVFRSQAVTSVGTQSVAIIGLIPNTQYYTHFVHQNAGGSNSNVISADGFTTPAGLDAIAPTLSSPRDSAAGATAAVIQVTTNEVGGSLFYVVTESENTPSFAQIVAGQDDTGGGATQTGRVTPVSIGVQTIQVGGLTADTEYTAHFAHKDASDNDSNVVSGDGFVTDASIEYFAGSRVKVQNGNTLVYADKNNSVSSLGIQPNNALGKVIESETRGFGGDEFVLVNFVRGRDGYVNIDNLRLVSSPNLVNYSIQKNRVPRGTATTSLSHQSETDINGDDIDDREEERVASLLNKVRTDRDRFNTLRFHGDSARIRQFTNVRESELSEDSGFDYPIGLYEFYAEVDAGSTETITLYLDDQYDTSDWSYRKYNSATGEYTDISNDVTYATAVVGGETVTTVSYDLVDNGPLDQDNRLGFVRDPAGPGESIPDEEDEEGEEGEEDDGGSESGSSGSTSSGGRRSSNDTNDTGNDISNNEVVVQVGSDAASLGSISSIKNNISFVQPQYNDPTDVQNLVRFLNHFEGESLPVDVIYDNEDNDAVKRFQNKYRREILDIWNLEEATGFVGITTRLKVNFLLNSETAVCPVFTEYNGGVSGIVASNEINKTQVILSDLDMYAGPIHGVWDTATNQALITFQETFHEVMLDPWNLDEGTGYKYKTTNKFLNYLSGCDTGPVELEGVGVYEGL